MRGDERLKEPGQDIGADGRRRTDHEVPRRRGLDLLEHIAPLDERPQRPLGVWNPRPPGIGQPHPVRSAYEEGSTQLTLETVKAGGQGRLGDEERLRGATHAAPACHAFF